MTTPLMTLAGYGPMPWEAAATLIGAGATLLTGLAAVVAAYRVGIRQVNIAERQTAILQRQTDTDYRRLQNELYDKRLGVYMRIIKFIDQLENTEQHVSNHDINSYDTTTIEAGLILSKTFHDFLNDNVEVIFECVKAINYYVQDIKSLGYDISQASARLAVTRSKLPHFRVQVDTLFANEMRLDIPPLPRISN